MAKARNLPERHRHRVLQLRAADLQHVLELDCLGLERTTQFDHRREQPLDAEPGRHAQSGGVDVVRALRRVHVVVRVQLVVSALGEAHVFERAVGDHLVRVHVGAGAGAALDHVDHELLVQRTADEIVAGLHDGAGARRVDHAQFGVRLRGGLLHESQRTHEFGHLRHGLARDRKVVHGTRGVNSPIRGEWDRHFTEEVVFDAVRSSRHVLVFPAWFGAGANCRARLHAAPMLNLRSAMQSPHNGSGPTRSRSGLNGPQPGSPTTPTHRACCGGPVPGVLGRCGCPSSARVRPALRRARAVST